METLMKKRISLMILAALFASALLAAEESTLYTVGVEGDLNNVAESESAIKDYQPITITPFLEYDNSLNDMSVYVYFGVPIEFTSENAYFDKDGNGAKSAVALELEENISYGLSVGSGTLTFALDNDNVLKLSPVQDVSKVTTLDGTIEPSIQYEFPLAGTFGATIKLPIGYATAGILEEERDNYEASFDLGWVLDWESEFGFGIEYEGGTILSDGVKDNGTDTDSAYLSWSITPRYTIGDLTAKLGIEFGTAKDVEWIDGKKYNFTAYFDGGLTITPEVEYALGAFILNGKVGIGNIGAKAWNDEGKEETAKLSVIPVISVSYSF
jgi:hypothetical protein